jgi:DNA-binding LacI/PurR family transcriptional regulator
MADVARHAGTTTTTVSRVLNESGYVRHEVRTRVLASIETLKYVPNANARTLKTKQSHTIGIVIGDLLNPYSAALADAVQRVAMARGYTTFVASAASDDVQSEIAVIEAFHRQRVAGLIVATLPTADSDEKLTRLAEHRLPLLLVGRAIAHPQVDTVSANFRRGGLICTQHLIELGHRRIAFIGAQLADAPRVNRLRGYLDALEQAGLPVRAECVIGHPNGPSPRYSTHLAGYQAVQQLLQLRPRPTAIFARNDYTAVGALQALREAGLRVPEDISLAGFDNIPLASAVSPALTTVSQPTEEEGRLAAEFLIARIERPHEDIARRELTLECNLIVRASTAPRSKAPAKGSRS